MKIRGFTYHGKTERIGYHFYCPGCKTPHSIYIAPHGEGRPVWQFSGTEDNPTFNPSLLMHRVPATADWPGIPQCHLFIRNGKIEFLGDCDHELKGQTVDIPDWPAGLWE